jgi:catechol 2,3-dioxygenase-like lactoylglutathione lyase family enzyme
MRTFHDAKAMAKSLREAMARRDVALSHAECLEIVAAQFGLADWNVLAAKIAGGETVDTIRINPGIPIIRIFDVAKAKEFYLDFLGFKQEWEHRFEPGMPLYTQIIRSGLTVHLSEHHGDASPGATVFIEMTGIEALHRELLGKRYGYARPGVEQAPWGRELQVADPFGNRLRFCEKT